MKLRKLLASVTLGAACALAGYVGLGAAAQETLKIAVIPKGTTHVFWKSVEAGARKAAEEAGVEMTWKGPLKENDRAQQIQIVEQFVAEGVKGIVLAPLDDVAMQRPVKAAMDKHIPVVIIDSGLKGEPGKDFVSFVATNNRQGGVLGGDALAKALGNKGKVVLLRYLEGSESTRQREEGFLSVMKQHPDIQVLVDNRYGGATAGDSKNTAMSMMEQLRNADGVFCSNEPTVFGMLLALRQGGLAGKIKFVGFDASPQLIDALKKGEIDALIVQNPRKMGYLGVKTLVAHLKGEKVEPTLDTGVATLTRENLDSPESKQILGNE
jgi:ribose transport system substrate-binding protein